MKHSAKNSNMLNEMYEYNFTFLDFVNMFSYRSLNRGTRTCNSAVVSKIPAAEGDAKQTRKYNYSAFGISAKPILQFKSFLKLPLDFRLLGTFLILSI